MLTFSATGAQGDVHITINTLVVYLLTLKEGSVPRMMQAHLVLCKAKTGSAIYA